MLIKAPNVLTRVHKLAYEYFIFEGCSWLEWEAGCLGGYGFSAERQAWHPHGAADVSRIIQSIYWNQNWDSGPDYSPRQSEVSDFRRLESDPRMAVLDLGCSISILAWRCHCSSRVGWLTSPSSSSGQSLSLLSPASHLPTHASFIQLWSSDLSLSVSSCIHLHLTSHDLLCWV